MTVDGKVAVTAQGSVASLFGRRNLRLLRKVIMPIANSPSEVVTAALLVTGGKILSGRTKDQNIGYVAEYLTALGIRPHSQDRPHPIAVVGRLPGRAP
jgi:hypothetical protein